MKKSTLALLIIIFSTLTCKNRINKEIIVEDNELAFRQEMIVDRITKGDIPRITEDFLLAGLTLDPKFERRFTNYSGDQTGRYLSALTLVEVDKQLIDIHDLVSTILTLQKPDGRFGTDSLSFEVNRIEGPQMALLWGNGRLLTGLLDYYEKYPKQEILVSAKKLGDFLDGITYSCTRPEIADRFKTMGAMGFICFTQITEGMVKLFNASGNEKYLRVAEKTYPLLPEFGNQHSHGFLNTLRGVVMLYEATKQEVHLAYAEEIFDKIIASENYMVTGGVPEFFSFHSNDKLSRDEGCSEADLFMLCIQLWEATGNMKYLDRGEYIFMNHMLYNQFKTGDFGHHVIKDDYGFVTAPTPGQSWWCCNYHGLQSLVIARNYIITESENIKKVNLFYPTSYKDKDISFHIQKFPAKIPTYEVKIHSKNDKNTKIAIRDPYWSKYTEVRINDIVPEITLQDGYIIIEQPLEPDDVIRFSLTPELKIIDKNLNEINLDLTDEEPVKGALIYGPWLLTVDDVYQNLFMTELSDKNIVFIPGDLNPTFTSVNQIPDYSFNSEAYLSMPFLKEGTSQTSELVLRPLSEVSFQSAANVRIWLNFKKSK